jgi:PAS domain S-box-containing protein
MSPLIRVGMLLALALGVGWMAVESRPEGVLGSDMWPAGLAAGALISARGRYAPAAYAAVAVIGFATFALGGRPLDFAVAGAVAILAEATVIASILTDRGRSEPTLLVDHDFSVLVRAVTAGGLTAGVVLGATAAVLTDSPPLLTGLGTMAGHMSSALVLLPFLLRTDEHAAVAPAAERISTWVALLVVTVAVFLPHDFPMLVFLVIPVLGWTALRSSLREAQLQLLTVATVATLLTSFGFGPLAEVEGDYALPQDVFGVVLQTFLIGCALVVIPLSLAVGQQLAAIGRAERESELLRKIIDSAHVAIIGSDQRGRVTLFNPGAERALGYRAAEVMGKFTRIFHTDRAIAEKAADLGLPDDFVPVALRMAEPDLAGDHIAMLRKDGTERLHSMTLSPIRDQRGGVTGYVCTSEDVTEEVAARQALVDALETERRAAERLREVDQVKDTFVSSVSHELRTPITSIVGYLEMLLEDEFGELSGHQRNAIRRIDTNSKRLLSLIDELLTLARIQEGQAEVADQVDLREVARTAYDVVAPSWAQRTLTTELSLPDCEVAVTGNRELLERMLVNLVGNAVKFTPDGGEVALRLVADHGDAVLTVSDTGIGIPEEEQQHLFTRFFRSSLAQRSAIQGSGLGLSLARAVAEEHSGTLQVDSVPGEGATFSVRIPLTRERNMQDSTTVALGDS